MSDLDWSIIENPERKWHEGRKRTIGSSDIPIIMGLSPYKTPLQLWQLKTGLVEPEAQNFAQARGTEMEPVAREWFNNKMNLNFKPKSFAKGRMTASLDGWNEATKQAVEIKFSGKDDHGLSCTGIVPPHYLAQVHWQYYVSDAEKIYYLSYQPNDSVIIEVPKPTERELQRLIDGALKFIEMVDNKIPPPLTDMDQMIVEDQELVSLAREYETYMSIIKMNQEKADAIKEKLLESAKGIGHKRIAIGAVSITKATRKGSIDTSSWAEAELHRKPDTEYYVVKLNA
jgi:putative phage-type endonuclease